MNEGKQGLWANIHAKRKRIKAGSGERMRKPGEKGAPTAADFKAAQNEEVQEIDTADYKLSKSGRKVRAHKIIFNKGEDDGKKGVQEQMKKSYKDFVEQHTPDLTEEQKNELVAELQEVLGKDDPAGKWISDFVHSDNPKFAGKSKEKRKQMALAAYYANQRKEEAEIEESFKVGDKVLHKEYGSGKVVTVTTGYGDKGKTHYGVKYNKKQGGTTMTGFHPKNELKKIKEESEVQEEVVAEGSSTDFAGRPVDQELVKRQEKYWNQAAKEKKDKEKAALKAKQSNYEKTPQGKAEKYWSKKGVAEGEDPNTQSHADAFKSETDTMRPGTKKYVGRKGGKEVTAKKDAQGNVKFYHRDGIKGPLKRVNEMDSQGYKGSRDDYELGKGKEHAEGEAETYKKHYNAGSGKVTPGANYRHDRAVSDYRKKAKEAGHIVESVFDWKNKPRQTSDKSTTMTKHDVKKTATGTVYTKQRDTDGMSKEFNRSGEAAQKRGRGRPKKNSFGEAVEFLMGLDEETFDSLMEEGFDSFYETYENLDEVSKATLGSYVKKAVSGMNGVAVQAHMAGNADSRTAIGKQHLEKARKRIAGIEKATDRLTK